ncbi:uncharacterized protein LACBIDRAFT_299041 [Laccaria bicolor S238N-H82]|uniref:Predicted protein n=1 Tax=Laccaria bicolor (strain S238N-H82 / ATCC MYA-4686) TaxID=486041 RepID=B0DDW9_LACBS|nr:uncharacterized protein LACBIDRAFT_299041 [Laccaria bicolor S238N-H82]EDR07291.1 predicted protein [Laccaria bicolor S238N-H82]|eukprot:XP_001882222.1 predicted protein [Laccaria bicolor S238N-H82]
MMPTKARRLRATNEKDALARSEVDSELAQRHGKTLSDLAEAKSKIAHLELQLKISQEAQLGEKMTSNHASSSNHSSDGKGGTDSAAKGRKSTKRTGSGYVYYRLYTEIGAFESNHPLYKNDRFIGRVPTKSFAPPHNVASIKLSLCGLEDLSEPDKALLFTPLSSPAPKEDSARLSLSAPSGPGLSELDPIVLVVKSEKRTKEVSQLEKSLPERSDDIDINYVYYRIYSSEGKGDTKAKTSFDESDISLGRINLLFIAPPHTAGSLKACIAKVEGVVTPGHPLYKHVKLFEDMNGDTAMSDTDVISFQGDTYPGSDADDPVALVKPDGPDSKFTKRARLRCTYDYHSSNSAWLSITKDEVVYTDGVNVSARYYPHNKSYPAYMVINSNGEKGFVEKERIAFY